MDLLVASMAVIGSLPKMDRLENKGQKAKALFHAKQSLYKQIKSIG